MANPSIAQPYWWDAVRPPALAMQPVPQRCDVAIVGAGFAGLSAALTLARAGRNVHVFDRQRPGEGASTRNAGIASGDLIQPLTELIERLGLERARTFYLEGQMARNALEAFVEAEGLDCHWQIAGLVHAASRAGHMEMLRRESDLLNTHLGVGASIVDMHQVGDAVGSERYHGAMIRPDIATLDPARLHAGLLALAKGAGAKVHGQTGVTRIHRNAAGKYELWTHRGPTHARDVVVATNGYTDRVSPWLRRRIIPVAMAMIATEPLPREVLARLVPNDRAVVETRRLRAFFRPTPDGRRLLFGSRDPNNGSSLAMSALALRQELAQIFPDLADVPVSHAWTGMMSYNRDRLPRLFSRDGVHYASSFCSPGVVWGHWLGTKAGQAVLGLKEAESAFSFRPPPALPLYTGKPWFAPLTTAWMRLADHLESRKD